MALPHNSPSSLLPSAERKLGTYLSCKAPFASRPRRRLHFAQPTSAGRLHALHRPPGSGHLGDQEERSLIEQCIVRDQKHLKDLSSWGIGGPCSYFLQVSRPSQLAAALRYCDERSIQSMVIGKGSNCLFDDRGFDGLVMLNRMEHLEVVEPGVYRVGSGYPFNRLGVQCSVEGFSGLEFAGGIPGTVGGAVFMNAGADGQETGDVVDSVEIVTKDGEFQVLQRSGIAFSYRWSSFQDMKNLAAITAVSFRLVPSAAARDKQRVLLQRRRETQPVGERCAGSVFRNPLDTKISAGLLIQSAGLKGFTIGGAKVSNVHANFFINYNRSTSRDMVRLIYHVKEVVDRIFQIELKEEIKYVPYRNRN